MARIIVTNNNKVKELFSDKADIIYSEGSSALDILKESKEVARSGGKLLLDPSKGKGYYRSLAFYKGDDTTPDDKSLSMLEKSIGAMAAGSAPDKGAILSGIYQNKDVDMIKKLMG